MTWKIPDWYVLVLLGLASYRTWLLLAEDKILDPVRDKLAPAESKRSEFISCAACFGFWIAIGWWLAWAAWSKWSLIVAAVFAVSGIVIIFAKNERD